MCGDDEEEQSQLEEELFGRLLDMAGHYGVEPTPGRDAPARLHNKDARTAYLDGLFKAGLTRAISDASNLQAGERMDAVCGQAIVYARLAGFLAGQFPPEFDQFKSVISALVEGHGEASSHG